MKRCSSKHDLPIPVRILSIKTEIICLFKLLLCKVAASWKYNIFLSNLNKFQNIHNLNQRCKVVAFSYFAVRNVSIQLQISVRFGAQKSTQAHHRQLYRFFQETN